MSEAIYTALIHKENDSDYGVSFPDFPGCITAGKTLEEAKVMEQEVIGEHISILKEMNQPIPSASSLDDVMSNPENIGAVVLLVTAPSLKSVRVNVTFPEDILRIIDHKAHMRHLSRSAFLAYAALNADDKKEYHTR